MAEQIGLADYVARLPYVVGHHLDDGHVVVGAFDESGLEIVHATIDLNPAPNAEEVMQALDWFIDRAAADTEIAKFTATGYGPGGQESASVIADALERTTGGIPARPIHVHDGAWSTHTGVLRQWSRPMPVPDADPALIVDGAPPPAPSRDALVDSVQPLDRPLFEPLAQDKAAALARLSPAQRADVATAALDHLAGGRSDEAGRMRILSHLVQDVVTRDAVLDHTIRPGGHHRRVEALIRTFRSAPAGQRGALAETAAATAYLAGRQPAVVRGLLQHAGRLTSLTDMIETALEHGINPAPIRAGLQGSGRQSVEQAEAVWHAERASERGVAGPTGSGAARRTAALGQPSPPTTPPGPDRRDVPGL